MPREALKRFAMDVADRLDSLGPIDTKPMFGAIALRKNGAMFGFVHDSRFFLKVDDEGIVAFEPLGGEPFTYETGSGQVTSRTTWSVPEEIFDDQAELIKWAERACVIATEKKASRKPRAAKKAS